MSNERKLMRVLRYLEGTKDRTIILHPKGIFGLEVYIDASFVTHVDGKSHRGIWHQWEVYLFILDQKSRNA
jgi:hypothetical protein